MQEIKNKLQKAGELALQEAKKILAKDGLALSGESWLSGQWFALATLRNAGFWEKSVVLNDIDVFKIGKYDPKLGSNEHLIIKNEKIYHAEPDHEGYKNREFVSIDQKTKYRIVATDHIDILNITNVVMEGESNNEGFDLIGKFDINSTQCAINTTTHEIVLTDAFVEFAKTQELKIVEVTTIGHSLVRLLKKRKELDCYVNIEKEFGKFLGTEHMFCPFFGEKLHKKYLENEDTFKNNGITAEEITFEDENGNPNKFPLFKLKRKYSKLGKNLAKWQSKFQPDNLAEFSDWLWSKSEEEIAKEFEKYEKLVDFEMEVIKKEGIYISSTILVNRFFMRNDFSYEKLRKLLEIAMKTDSYLYLVNCFADWEDIDKWIKAINFNYANFLTKSFHSMYYEQNKIHVDTILANSNEYDLDNFIKESPSLGCTNMEKTSILGVHNKKLLIIEIEFDKDMIKVFGYDLADMQWKEQKLSKYGFVTEFEKSKELQFLFEDKGNVLLPENFQEKANSLQQIPEIDIDNDEIPF